MNRALLSKWAPALLGAILCLAMLATWWPVLHNDFVNYDDGGYVTQNTMVRQGLTPATFVWAFRSTAGGNWHPLTWLSHALDCQCYGLSPAGHHLTSLLLHVLNTGLVFFLLARLTGTVGRSGFVAALFALHPLRVESVAWVSERKDVLSAFFFLLTIWAYGQYVLSRKDHEAPEVAARRLGDQAAGVRRQDVGVKPSSILHPPPSLYYTFALLFFALGLMSKPMLVTLPFVLLLLDYWPLARFELSALSTQPSVTPQSLREEVGRAVLCTPPRAQDVVSAGSGLPALPSLPYRLGSPGLWHLLKEKLPFFALSALASVVTLLVQTGGGNTASVPLSFRVANTLVAYSGHLLKVLWPQPLSVLYLRPVTWPVALVAGCALMLAGVTAFVCWRGRAQRYLLTGWFWFLGMLVPVIGLVAIGDHWRADRYTYLPAIGLVLAVVWGAWELASRWRAAQIVLPAMGLLALAACALSTRAYLSAWKDSLTLVEHSLQVDSSNHVAYYLGASYFRARGEHDRAGEYCSKSLLLCSANAPAWNLMASLLADEGKLTQALTCASNSIAVKPDWSAEAYCNRGTIWLELGGRAEAMADFERALRLNPQYVPARMDLATLQMGDGQLERAIENYQVALQLDPGHAVGRYNLANALNRAGRFAEAIQQYQRALQLNPSNAAAHCNLAQALLRQQRTNEAGGHFESALRLDPSLAQAHYGLGMTLYQAGQPAQALAHLRQALQPNPDFPAALDQLGWILATTPQPELRNGAEAVRVAERACQLTGQHEPRFLATLSAAYAEAGRLDDAIAVATKARELAQTAGQEEIAARAIRLLASLQAGRSFHEPPQGPR